MAHRAFTICACNMDAFEFRLWITEEMAKRYSIGQVFFKSRCANAAKHGEAGKKVVNGLLVVHYAKIRKGITLSGNTPSNRPEID